MPLESMGAEWDNCPADLIPDPSALFLIFSGIHWGIYFLIEFFLEICFLAPERLCLWKAWELSGIIAQQM